MPDGPIGVNQMWTMDFMHDILNGGRRFRTLNIVGCFSRKALAVEVDTTLSGHRVVRVLQRLLETRGKPQVIQVDNGPAPEEAAIRPARTPRNAPDFTLRLFATSPAIHWGTPAWAAASTYHPAIQTVERQAQAALVQKHQFVRGHLSHLLLIGSALYGAAFSGNSALFCSALGGALSGRAASSAAGR